MNRMASERLILPLDVDSPERALDLARRLAPWVGVFKVNPAHALAEGGRFVEQIKKLGRKVFLDLKFYDIPETVARATRQAAALGADFLTLHVGGGSRMLAAARASAGNDLKLLGVTVLTSFDQAELEKEWKLAEPIADRVVFWAGLAREAGLHGVVCSPLELARIRAAHGRDLVTVVPGIRPGNAPADDQRRTLPPREAIALGADYLVVGRPILSAASPEDAAAAILREIEEVRA